MYLKLFSSFFKNPWVLASALVFLSSCVGTSTDTESCRGTSTDTEQCEIKVVTVEVKRGNVLFFAGTEVNNEGDILSKDKVAFLAEASSGELKVHSVEVNKMSTVVDTVTPVANLSQVFRDANDAVVIEGTIYPSGVLANIQNKDGSIRPGMKVAVRTSRYVPKVAGSNVSEIQGVSDDKGMVSFTDVPAGDYMMVGKDSLNDVLFFKKFKVADSIPSQAVIATVSDVEVYKGIVVRQSGLSVKEIHAYIPGTAVSAVVDSSGLFRLTEKLSTKRPSFQFQINSVIEITDTIPLATTGRVNLADSVAAGLCSVKTESAGIVVDTTGSTTIWKIMDVDRSSCR